MEICWPTSALCLSPAELLLPPMLLAAVRYSSLLAGKGSGTKVAPIPDFGDSNRDLENGI